MRIFGRAVRFSIIAGLMVFILGSLPQVRLSYFTLLDQFDSRPARRILFVGNSHTFYNDLPWMVRRIADSAQASEKYVVQMEAVGGAYFRNHWENPSLHDRMQEGWGDIVLQGGSAEPVHTAETRQAFFSFGRKLVEGVKQAKARPVLYVTWVRDMPAYEVVAPEQRDSVQARDYETIQSSYASLASQAGASMVNVGKIWRMFTRQYPQIVLYQADGNHATVAGSYLTALAFYQFFSQDDLRRVTYVPDGVSPQEAATMIQAVMAYR